MTKEIKRAGETESIMDSILGGDIGVSGGGFGVRNHIYFNEDINDNSTKELVMQLHELALGIVDECLKTGCEPCPIELHLNSKGGSLEDSLQIIQTIENIQSGRACKVGETFIPICVNTHIEGEVDSGASLVACVGSYRTCSKYSMCLIHPMRSIDATYKTIEEQTVAIKNNARWNEIYLNIYLKHSSLSKEELEEMMKTETFYTPEELIKFGLIEEIV